MVEERETLEQEQLEFVKQEEQYEEQEPQQEQPQQQQQQRPQERNFRELREKAARIEQERDLALKKLQELEQSRQQSFELKDDDLVEGKHLSKYDKKIKDLETQIEQYAQKTSEVATETRLKAQYQDFDKVVTEANINQLRELYPEIADTINSTGNLYNKAVAAYTMIKKLGIIGEDNYQQDRSTAQRNAAKPRPTSSISPQQGDTPLSRANAFANGLTDEVKAQLRKEMEEARRGY